MGRDRRPGSRFIGNEELARRRAAAANSVIEAACRTAGKTDLDACFVGGRDAVSPTGQGELYTLTRIDPSGQTQEVEGAPLAEHAAAAVPRPARGGVASESGDGGAPAEPFDNGR